MMSSNSNITSSTTTTHKKSRSTKSKLFQCTGFGDCHMVFTRSEHLARHVRKHTGEKPFECVVLGCSRKFSRFDNMMQHTQTHRPRQETTTPSPITSPESLLFEPESSPEYYTAESSVAADSSDEEEVVLRASSSSLYHHHHQPLSVNQLCSNNQQQPLLKELHLTQDEFEALQGFGRFKQTPILIDSFRDLASVVYIDPNPSRS